MKESALRVVAVLIAASISLSAKAQIRAADIVYTFHQAESQPGLRLQDECFVSLDTIKAWGWRVVKQGDTVQIEAEGKTIELGVRTGGGRRSIPLKEAIAKLDGEFSWSEKNDRLSIDSHLTKITASDSHLHVEGALSYQAKVDATSGNTVIDLTGARLTSKTVESLGSTATVTQIDPDTVRIALSGTPSGNLTPAPGRMLDLDLTTSPSVPIPTPKPALPEAPKIKVAPAPVKIVPARPKPIVSTTNAFGSILSDSADRTMFAIPVPNLSHAVVTHPTPDSLQLTVEGLPSHQELAMPTTSCDSIRSVAEREQPASSTFTFKLARPMGALVSCSPQQTSIEFFHTPLAAQPLLNEVLVVDPGHGGHDRGTHFGDLNEKDITLPIGAELGEDLANAGATVVMTRTDDTFVPLVERSEIANRNHARLFISCHINSTGGESRPSGTITFHKQKDSTSLKLATCIQDQIARVSGLPGLGAWSDSRIYEHGFSVLRNTRVPCVLIEMGFINNPVDRSRIVTGQFQNAVASAVMKGVKSFLSVEPSRVAEQSQAQPYRASR